MSQYSSISRKIRTDLPLGAAIDKIVEASQEDRFQRTGNRFVWQGGDWLDKAVGDSQRALALLIYEDLGFTVIDVRGVGESSLVQRLGDTLDSFPDPGTEHYTNPDGPDMIVRTYRGTYRQALASFQAEAALLEKEHYAPGQPNWVADQYDCGAFLVALILCILLIGFLIFIYMLIVKPDSGILTVQYQRKPAIKALDPDQAPGLQIDSGEIKECPDCAETVKVAAKICRFCRHQF